MASPISVSTGSGASCKRLMAEAVIDKAGGGAGGAANGTGLFEESGKLPQYRGLVVDSIERKPDRVVSRTNS